MKIHARLQVYSNVEQQQRATRQFEMRSFIFHSQSHSTINNNSRQSTQLWLKKYTTYTHNHRVCLSTSVKKQVLFWTDESIWMCYSNLLLRLPLATNKNKPIAKIKFISPAMCNP